MLKMAASNKKFRSFLFMQTFANLGHGMFSIIMMWLVHSHYQNPFYTGLAGVMFALPNVANFIAGPFIDRHNKVTLIRVACFVQFCIVGFLLLATFVFDLVIWVLLAAILVFHSAAKVSIPAATALLPKIVGGDELVSANVMRQVVAIVVGLVIGVFLFTVMDSEAGFRIFYAVLAVILFLAVVATLFIRDTCTGGTAASLDASALKKYFAELGAGFVFIRRGIMLYLLVAFMAAGVFTNIAGVSTPMLAEIHSGTGSGYLLLVAMSMVGAMLGAGITKRLADKFKLWKIFAGGWITMGAFRIIFINVIADSFTRALVVAVFYYAMGNIIAIFFITLRQKQPPKLLIGRIDTIATSMMGVSAVVGAFVGGVLGTWLTDIHMVFAMQGVAYIVIGACLCLFKKVRTLPGVNDVVACECEN